MVSMDTLVIKIMNFAQRLVDADRASLFLVDSKSKELYATIFDVGVVDSQNREKVDSCDENIIQQPSREIRFAIGTGIGTLHIIRIIFLFIVFAFCFLSHSWSSCVDG